MTQEKVKCDYENCSDNAANHATFEQVIPDGYISTIRTYHYNFCPVHLAKVKSEFSPIKVYEIGNCDDENCVLGKLPRTSEIQK